MKFRDWLLNEFPEIKQVYEGSKTVELAFVGLGAAIASGDIFGEFSKLGYTFDYMQQHGAAGGINYNYFDKAGQQIGRGLLTLSVDELRSMSQDPAKTVVLVGGGPHKEQSVEIVLKTRMTNAIITDEDTAWICSNVAYSRIETGAGMADMNTILQKPPKRHWFIVLEGVDGVGKSTVAQALANRLQGTYFRTPTATVECFAASFPNQGLTYLRPYFDQYCRESPRTRFAFYLMCVSEAICEIRRLLEDHDVVCDRFIASTLAYHRSLDPTLNGVDVAWVAELQPDIQILLDVADGHEHLHRLNGRIPRSDKSLEEDIAFLNTVKTEFRKLGLYTIDTTHRTVQSIVDEIVGLLPDLDT